VTGLPSGVSHGSVTGTGGNWRACSARAGIIGSATGTSLVLPFLTGAKYVHPATSLTCASMRMVLRR
jgi:hypothetical protein